MDEKLIEKGNHEKSTKLKLCIYFCFIEILKVVECFKNVINGTIILFTRFVCETRWIVIFLFETDSEKIFPAFLQIDFCYVKYITICMTNKIYTVNIYHLTIYYYLFDYFFIKDNTFIWIGSKGSSKRYVNVSSQVGFRFLFTVFDL